MKDIKGFEGVYGVTSCGKVWSYRSKRFLRPWKAGKGYLEVHLSKSGEEKKVYIHRLVADAYIPNPENKPQVNHRDEVKTNNCVNNLEWMTNKENNNYGTKRERQSATWKIKKEGL